MANSHWLFPRNTDTTWMALFIWFWGIDLFFLYGAIGHVTSSSLEKCTIYSNRIPVNLLSTFSTGSSTKSAIPRNIFSFFCTLDVKPFKLHRYTCGRVKVFLNFHMKSYDDVLEISESFFKHHTVFPLTLAVSNIYNRATITQRQDFYLAV